MSPEIQKIDEFFSQHFIKKTFKDLSYDDSNDVHLVQNETEAYAFDKIKDQLTNKGMCSADALYFSDGDFVNFIEFKNGNIDEAKLAELESIDNCFAEIDYRVYVSIEEGVIPQQSKKLAPLYAD